MSLYVLILFCHSYLRWALLGVLLVLLARNLKSANATRPWTERDERLHVILVALTDLQLLLGLVLYFGLSPVTHAFLASPGTGMKDGSLRFFGVEHLVLNLLGIVILHVGRVRGRKSPNAATRRRRVRNSLIIALVCFLAAIPWPFLAHAGRPLLRGITGN